MIVSTCHSKEEIPDSQDSYSLFANLFGWTGRLRLDGEPGIPWGKTQMEAVRGGRILVCLLENWAANCYQPFCPGDYGKQDQ